MYIIPLEDEALEFYITKRSVVGRLIILVAMFIHKLPFSKCLPEVILAHVIF